MTVEPTTQDKQITIDVPEDRVAEFYAFYGRFLAGAPGGRRGRGRGPRPPPRARARATAITAAARTTTPTTEPAPAGGETQTA